MVTARVRARVITMVIVTPRYGTKIFTANIGRCCRVTLALS